ncbi:acetylornithine transaminase [Desulfatirhabdium butyrativorans]|uniref:acetylornithine transaminase n=1 Tax=Desulfatirhabdium butyrativorans TaxID=340467 RepID=UPI00040387C9|nr:acetylornithine transaminase [Desulfatirhabdium butyrativorans]
MTTSTPSAWIDAADRHIAGTYKRFPIVLTRGKGCSVWDVNGKAYRDFVAGIAVCNLGHCHPEVTAAVCEQAGLLVHVSNLYYTQPQIDVARMLTANSFADRVFFCNSGAEANEAAIKIARKYFQDRGETDRFEIVSMKQSFHGRTMATLSATGQEKIRKGFDPILPGFRFVPYNDIDALRENVNGQTCAVLLEPIQGEGGIRIPDPGYLHQVRQICDVTGALLIYDEIQTGMGRTSKLFAHEHDGVRPDIMTLAKALANGLPMGAMLCTEKVSAAFSPGAHASTFGGTPLVTAASRAVLRLLTETDILEHCRIMGDRLAGGLRDLARRHSVVRDVRGKGLMVGAEIDGKGADVVMACMEKGFLINCVQENVLRFVPPLVVEADDIDALLSCLDEVLG